MSWFWLVLEPFRKRAPLPSLWNGLSKASTKPQTVARNLWRCVFCPTIWSWLSRVDRTICVISPWQIPKHSARNNSSDRKRNQGGLILISTVGGFSQVLSWPVEPNSANVYLRCSVIRSDRHDYVVIVFSQSSALSCFVLIEHFCFPALPPEGI